jgi:hypothetical protein
MMVCSNDTIASWQCGGRDCDRINMPVMLDAPDYQITFGEERLFRVISVELPRSRLKLKQSLARGRQICASRAAPDFRTGDRAMR